MQNNWTRYALAHRCRGSSDSHQDEVVVVDYHHPRDNADCFRPSTVSGRLLAFCPSLNRGLHELFGILSCVSWVTPYASSLKDWQLSGTDASLFIIIKSHSLLAVSPSWPARTFRNPNLVTHHIQVHWRTDLLQAWTLAYFLSSMSHIGHSHQEEMRAISLSRVSSSKSRCTMPNRTIHSYSHPNSLIKVAQALILRATSSPLLATFLAFVMTHIWSIKVHVLPYRRNQVMC